MGARGKKSANAALTVVEVSGQRILPPDHLTDQQAGIWQEITNSLPADYFRPGDVPLLAAYCKAYSFYLEAAKEIEAEGPTLVDDRGRKYTHPAGQMVVTQASALAQLAVKLRLCPSARYTEKSAATKTRAGGVGGKPWEFQG